MNRTIEYHDEGPDRLGRRSFALFWEDPAGIFRPELHPDDGKPVGYRRVQEFFCDPSGFDPSLAAPPQP